MSSAGCCLSPPFTRDSRSKKLYCKEHFTEFIEYRVRKTISQYKMLNRSDHIGLGYSGGKDSTTLLHILDKLRARFQNSKITAITIDEGIKGYRNGCLDLAKKITNQIGINHIIVSFKQIYGVTLDQIVEKSINKKRILPCSICGILRRRALNIAAEMTDVTKIATAHNLDDEAQTILMNMLRGDTIKFIRHFREPVQRYQELKPRIRPLVRVTEPEIVLYAVANDLEYHSVPCPYAPSAMRNDIRKFLSESESKRPSTLINIVNLHDSIAEYFPHKSNIKIPFRCKKCGEISTHKICPVCLLLNELDLKNPYE